MNKQLKQQIINVFTALKANISFKAFEAGVHSALSTPSILRHCDPEIMKQAGWVRDEEWISIEDSLPNNRRKVLVYTNYKRTHITTLETDSEWDIHPLTYEDEIITHWKPLPQPPKQ